MRYLIIALLLFSRLAYSQLSDNTITTNINNLIRNITIPGGVTHTNEANILQSIVDGKISVIGYSLATGTNTYVASVASVSSYIHGQVFKIEFQNANTGSSTLNINGLGSVLLTSDGSTSIISGAIKAGQVFWCYYNGTAFQLVGGGIGGVLSVSGTSNRISSTGGANPIINIDPAYVGQSSINTVGTIISGTWNGSIIPVIYGGTGTATPGINAGTNISVSGTWPNQTISATASGITNSALNNELMKSNGTNAVSSGLFSSASGDLDLGTTSLTGNRTINAQSSSLGSALIVKGNYVTGGNIEFLRITSNGNTGGGAIETPSNAWLAINSNTSNTNSINPALFLISQPSGTPTTGHGISLNLESTNVGGQYSKAASIQAVYTDVTASSQNADLVVKLANNSTTVSEAFRILSSGAVAFGGSTNYGTSGQVLSSNGSGSAPTWTTITNVAGSDAQIQFNSSGILSASPNFLFHSSNNSFAIGVPSSNSQIDIQSSTNDASFSVGGSAAMIMHTNITSSITEFYGNTSNQYFGNSSNGTGSTGNVHVSASSALFLSTLNQVSNTASDITITSGSATTSGNFSGGNIKLVLGTGIGTGHSGRLNISGLPTSSSGLSSGDVWNNSGVLTIVP